jgi:hypothetical protein
MGAMSTMWFFSRGAESVRVVRLTAPDGSWRLLIDGPDPGPRLEECADLLASVQQQAELERQLIEAGFRLQRLATTATA